MENNQLLLYKLDRIKLAMNPLPVHLLAKRDLHLRHSYAALLAAMLLAKGGAQESEIRLFELLLRSMGLEQGPAKFMDLAGQQDESALLNFFQDFTKEEWHLSFILDALLINRIDAPLEEVVCSAVAECLTIWRVSDKNIKKIIAVARVVLGLGTESIKGIDCIKIKNEVSMNPWGVSAAIDYKVFEVYSVPGNFVLEDERILGLVSAKSKRSSESTRPADQVIFAPKEGVVIDIHVQPGDVLKTAQPVAEIFPLPKFALHWKDVIRAANL